MFSYQVPNSCLYDNNPWRNLASRLEVQSSDSGFASSSGSTKCSTQTDSFRESQDFSQPIQRAESPKRAAKTFSISSRDPIPRKSSNESIPAYPIATKSKTEIENNAVLTFLIKDVLEKFAALTGTLDDHFTNQKKYLEQQLNAMKFESETYLQEKLGGLIQNIDAAQNREGRITELETKIKEKDVHIQWLEKELNATEGKISSIRASEESQRMLLESLLKETVGQIETKVDTKLSTFETDIGNVLTLLREMSIRERTTMEACVTPAPNEHATAEPATVTQGTNTTPAAAADTPRTTCTLAEAVPGNNVTPATLPTAGSNSTPTAPRGSAYNLRPRPSNNRTAPDHSQFDSRSCGSSMSPPASDRTSLGRASDQIRSEFSYSAPQTHPANRIAPPRTWRNPYIVPPRANPRLQQSTPYSSNRQPSRATGTPSPSRLFNRYGTVGHRRRLSQPVNQVQSIWNYQQRRNSYRSTTFTEESIVISSSSNESSPALSVRNFIGSDTAAQECADRNTQMSGFIESIRL